MPPVYLRTQQLSWLEINAVPANAVPASTGPSGAVPGSLDDRACHAQLKSARVELPGATRFERFLAAARNPHAAAPKGVASWPEGPDWPADSRHLKHKHLKRAARKAVKRATTCTTQP
jgi:hypothetical protein